MADALTALNQILGEVADLQRASELLEWDERVYMPPAAAASHGEMTATLRKVAHEMFTSAEVGRLLDQAALEAILELDLRSKGIDPSGATVAVRSSPTIRAAAIA